jgi:hypothetical protein
MALMHTEIRTLVAHNVYRGNAHIRDTSESSGFCSTSLTSVLKINLVTLVSCCCNTNKLMPLESLLIKVLSSAFRLCTSICISSRIAKRRLW